MVSTTFSGPSAAYKLNYSRYCFRYYFHYYFRYCFRYYFRHYFSPYTPYIDLATTARINLAVACHSPPYRGAARL